MKCLKVLNTIHYRKSDWMSKHQNFIVMFLGQSANFSTTQVIRFIWCVPMYTVLACTVFIHLPRSRLQFGTKTLWQSSVRLAASQNWWSRDRVSIISSSTMNNAFTDYKERNWNEFLRVYQIVDHSRARLSKGKWRSKTDFFVCMTAPPVLLQRASIS